MPPSLRWERLAQLRSVQAALSRQIITEADKATVSASLDKLADDSSMMEDFKTELTKRIAGIKRQLEIEPWKSKRGDLISCLNGCAQLVAEGTTPETAPKEPDGGWTTNELILRDLAAIRLANVIQMISIEPLLNDKSEVKAGVLKKLQSNDQAKLLDARNDLVKLSQGISEQDVKAALE